MSRSARTGWVSALASCLLVVLVSLPNPAAVQAQDRDRIVIAPRGPMAFGFNRARLGIELRGRATDSDMDGAEIRRVLRDSPADDAGLERGDIITHVNGQSLLEALPDADDEDRIDLDASIPSQRLRYLVRELEEGDEVVIDYLRDGQEASTTVEIDEARSFGWSSFGPGDGEFYFEPRSYAFEMPELDLRMDELRHRLDDVGVGEFDFGTSFWSSGYDGLSLMTLTPGLGRYFDAEEGVLVTDVDEDSDYGLEAGDVITAIDGRSVDSPRDIRRILRSYEEGEAVTFTIMRDRTARDVQATIQ